MKNDGQKQQLLHQRGGGKTNGFIPNSFRTISSCLRIVSSGASMVARSAASVASSIVDKDDDDADPDHVIWAGFDKLDSENGFIHRVLLLGYRSGFQVWHVDESNNVRDLVSRHDGPVSFMQAVPNPIGSKRSEDKFANSRPLLVVCTDGFFASGSNVQDGNGNTSNSHDQVNGNCLPTTVQFYSMKSQSYVHVLKFRSVVYSVRCSHRIVAICQSTQIHCFNATTLEREYTLLTNPIVMSSPGSGGIGYGPLAVGPRWLAYSGSPVAVSTSGRVSPQHLAPSNAPGFSSNGSLIAHYAKESSKNLASGIVTLGDMGYKKISKYYSDSNGSSQSVSSGTKGNGTINGHLADADNIGMVTVRDIVTKNIVAQFPAHKSPISALCFDPSGTILVTASVQGHNINVFKIMPRNEQMLASDAGPSYVHLYKLQRGFTNAVIQDISFSNDSKWILISSSRGTSHLFAINPLGGYVNIQTYDDSLTVKNSGLGIMTNQAVRWPHSSASQMPQQQSLCAVGPPLTLSVVSRIRNGANGWKGAVSGAAAAATGKKSSLSGAIASSFLNCNGSGALYVEGNHSKAKYRLMVFSPTGSMIQYALRTLNGQDSAVVSRIAPSYESIPQPDARLVIEATHKWNICQRHSRQVEDNVDIYGESGISDSNKIYPEDVKEEDVISPKIKNVALKGNSSSLEDRHHLYISEAELQMHQAQTPLWAKPQIYFHSILEESTIMDEEAASGGEFENERIPTRMIEVRSKDLVPIVDYIQTLKLQQTRIPAIDGKINEQLSSQLSGNGRSPVSPRTILGSPESMTSSGGAVTEVNSEIEGATEWHDHLAPPEMMNYVNNNHTLKPNSQHDIVNNITEHLNHGGSIHGCK
ncbi:putative transcription factor WD40-like family [Lupinus albus]|uniref:Putative transcription factor WD40-like family n=1 Tax=Lupinus albus TaxID=3870 RepID=A0A6A4NGN8_LUPAL|nr:putative transcription factor WD40-like family [Lupinus albus]